MRNSDSEAEDSSIPASRDINFSRGSRQPPCAAHPLEVEDIAFAGLITYG